MSDLQERFAQDAARLIEQAAQMGYGVTLGEAWRTPQQAQWDADHGSGINCSLHLQRLAIDLNLFINGEYQANDAQGCYSKLGAWWKGQGSDHYWGGDFKPLVDLDHYSISPDGGHTK
jgi:hypothetical protein